MHVRVLLNVLNVCVLCLCDEHHATAYLHYMCRKGAASSRRARFDEVTFGSLKQVSCSQQASQVVSFHSPQRARVVVLSLFCVLSFHRARLRFVRCRLP